MDKRLALLLPLLLVASLLLSACDRKPEEPPRPLPLGSPVAIAAARQQPPENQLAGPPATFTPFPTVTLPPTFTPVLLTSTPVPSPASYWSERNRLTGELTADLILLQRRPIAVKISNAPARWTRPQSGLSQADLVFEHLTEGSITRFTAIFYGQTPPKIGPIRSARLIDLELPAMYDAALAYSGSSIGVSRLLFDSDFRDRILRTNTAGYYRTGEKKPYEHTLYAEPELLWGTLESRGENRQPEFGATMAFDQATPPGGEPVGSLTVQYYRFSTVEWRYDPASGRFLRWVDGDEHLDANSERQISASNVVVLLAPHFIDETICEHQSGDRCLAYSTEIPLQGAGRAVVLRDGRAFHVSWRRPERHAMLVFYEDSGRPFPLQTGNTWFQVVPLDYPEAYSISAPDPEAELTPTPAVARTREVRVAP